MPDRPSQGIRSNNRIQYETTIEDKKVFREYWIHEWDGKGYEVNEHINDINQAIKRALCSELFQLLSFASVTKFAIDEHQADGTGRA